METSLYALGRRIAEVVRATFKSTPLNLTTSPGKRSILSQKVNDSIFKGYSYAQVLSCIAKVCGSFAVFDNDGDLSLRWFKASDVTLTGDSARKPLELNGNTFSMDGNIVQVTGVNVISEDTELAHVGTDKYLLTLNENPIANAMPETAANAVLYRLKNTKYIPCRYARIGGDPSLQVGDIVTVIDNKETYNEADYDSYDKYPLYMTSRSWTYNCGGFSDTYCAAGNAERDLNTDRGMTQSKRLAQLAKRVTEVEKNITEGMTDYEAALLMFNDKLFNANGLYKTVREKENGGVIVYFHDEAELENSQVIQMFSAAGFAWTTDGWNNGEPLWRYGFTDAGDAILNTINAYILSADIIKTGLLQSQNGASWINMDNGTFCFRTVKDRWMDVDTGEVSYTYENKLLLNEENELLINGKIVNNRGADIIYYHEHTSPTTGTMHNVLDIGDILEVQSVYINADEMVWLFADEVHANATTLATTSDKRLKYDIKSIFSISTTVQAYSNSLVGHPPPFTPEEYKKIRYAESLEQSITLKKCFTSDLYKDYYTCGDIFNFWGARYRLLAIDRFEHCLQIHPNASLYRVLGDLYEKDHRFQDAQAMYQMYLDKMPEYPAGYVFVARCLLKQNKIDEALDFLNDAKSTEYYLNPTAESHFDTCIDDKYREYAEKKAHGYIFKPKKITVEYIEVGSMSIEDICTDYLKKWQ